MVGKPYSFQAQQLNHEYEFQNNSGLCLDELMASHDTSDVYHQLCLVKKEKSCFYFILVFLNIRRYVY